MKEKEQLDEKLRLDNMRDQHEAVLHQGDKYEDTDTDSDKTPTDSKIVEGKFNMQY